MILVQQSTYYLLRRFVDSLDKVLCDRGFWTTSML